jgi:hypothetical protein
MDELELEERLRARLHVRFDGAVASPALHETVARTLATEAPTLSPWRRAVSAWPRQLLAVAAVVAAIAVVAVTLRFSALPGPVGPGASATPGASVTPSPSNSPGTSPSPTAAASSPTVPPISTAAWTSLDIRALTGAPILVSAVAPWSGGYVAYGQVDASTGPQFWLSREGRSWTVVANPTLAPATGLGEILGIAGCGNGLLVATRDTARTTTTAWWFSTDGQTYVRLNSGASLSGLVASGTSGAVAAASSGASIGYTTDCQAWQTVALPGPADATVTGVAPFGSGFVAVGYAGQPGSSSVRPRAWWSADGQHWSLAGVAAKPGDGFVQVEAGHDGLIALSTQPGLTPGSSSIWSSADGRSWALSDADPLGTITAGEGVGSAAGQFAGDGTRLLAYGTQHEGGGPVEYWVSSDGTHWTKLALGGAGSAALAGDDQAAPFLMRDGLLFGGQAASWFGSAATP